VSNYKRIAVLSTGLLSVDRPPASSAFLAGICEKLDIEYDIFDFNIIVKNALGISLWERLFVVPVEGDHFVTIDPELLAQVKQAISAGVDKLIAYNPDLIAVSVLSFIQHPYAKLVTQAIREKMTTTIIAGGPGIGYQTEPNVTMGKQLMDQGLLDYYVLGEGDYIFEAFLKGQHELGLNVKGAKWENWVPQIDNLDGLTFPSYKKVKFREYISSANDTGTPIASITGSRGCVRRCTFCDVGNIWKKFRFRSGDNISQELLHHYQQTGILTYHFTDSLINGSLKQFIDLLKNIIQLQEQYPEFKQLKFSGQFIVRPIKHHPEYLYELMQQAGCHRLEVGIESGSDRVREHMGKKFSNEDIDYHYAMCSKYKITNSLLMFTGYPTETLEDHHDTLNMLRRYQKYLIDETITMLVLSEPMVYLRNTPLAETGMQEELGIHLFNNEYGNTLWTSDTNPGLTNHEKYRRFLETNRLSVELGYPRSFDVIQRLLDHIREMVHFKSSNLEVKEKFDNLIANMLTEGV
jgi:radical SAM superfamily enzyme YgiQ (UPF0313 family)